ncbi:DNA repair protein RAD51 homolog 3, partial [Planococcus citri]|uniref:DNA repair protein RAD51 homolog 3 n=1 Tax=Planococcus citri TaxID=170843 RepID=UPI0031F84265
FFLRTSHLARICEITWVKLHLQIQRPLWTLPISDLLQNKLKDAGFDYVEDILHEANAEATKQIVQDTKLDLTQFTKISTKTALEALKADIENDDNIVTFSKAIDDLFDGGIPTGRLTELIGAPGCGKTQLCLQLCVSVQMPKFLGGLDGYAVYIETNSNFSVKRIKEIHKSCASHCVNISQKLPSSSRSESDLQQFLKENPLRKIIKFSVENVEELRSSIFTVRSQLETSSNNVKLIVIDSFIFPFYLTDADLDRTKMVTEILIQLHQLASNHHLAVVITNELTTCILDNGATEVTPSLGESFAHIIHNRVMLGKQKRDDFYSAIMQKSFEYSSGSAYFQICQDGVRDVPTE